MDLLKDIDCFLLDLDGTVYFGNTLLPGAAEAIERMKKCGKRVIFLTNNSSQTRDFYVKKLCGMGINVTKNDVYTSANATQDWLKENMPSSRLFVMASPEVVDEFKSAGLIVDGNADAVVLTFDKTLDYRKLVKGCDLIAKGAYYIATHPDFTCPVENGELPDIGSFMMLIEGTTNRRPNVICGKPYKIIAECIAKMTGIPLSRTAMLGDRLTTDMKFALDNGLRSVLTLTGVTDLAAYKKSELKVDAVINSISEWDA